MTKLVQNDIASLTNEQAALAALNANYASLEVFSDSVLSRDGTSPNQMNADLDMNSNSILNLPAPASASEPLRLQDLANFVGGGSLIIPSPGGVTGSIQFNNGGFPASFGGDTNFLYDSVNKRLSLGDAAFKIDFNTGTEPFLQFDTNDYLSYNRAANEFHFGIGAVNKLAITGSLLYPITNDGIALGTTSFAFSDLFLASGAVINFNNGDVTLVHSADALSFFGAASGYFLNLVSADNPISFRNNATYTQYSSVSFNNTHTANAMMGMFGGKTSGGADTNLYFESPGGHQFRIADNTSNGMQIDPGIVRPLVNDGSALGSTSFQWSDLFLASGSVINWNNGDVLLTHSADTLTWTGASGYCFDNFVRPVTNDGAPLGAGTLAWSDLFLASGAVINFANGDTTLTHSTGALALSKLLDLSGASAGQIKFPASQNASANANTLDDYEEGTWTPVITFATPGNLNVVYSGQTGTYTKIGRLVSLYFNVSTSTFTHTTASGVLQITGAPFTAVNNDGFSGGQWSGLTKANYTDVAFFVGAGTSTVLANISGSGQALANVTTADLPTGVNKTFTARIHYEV